MSTGQGQRTTGQEELVKPALDIKQRRQNVVAEKALDTLPTTTGG